MTASRPASLRTAGYLVDNFEERWSDPARREVLVESQGEMMAAANHLLAVARKPERA